MASSRWQLCWRTEDLPNVVVAGYDPVIDRFTVKGRCSCRGGGKEGVRIGEVFRAQWIEANGRHLSFGSCDRIHWIAIHGIPRGRPRTPPGTTVRRRL